MYVIQNLKSSLYGICGARVVWHTNREFATWFETREDAEEAIEKLGLDRDTLRIVKVYV